MVDRAALEMRSTRKGTGGSNPSLSASSTKISYFTNGSAPISFHRPLVIGFSLRLGVGLRL